MFMTYLANHETLPSAMFTEELLQIRHTYSKSLRQDKISEIVAWILERSKNRQIWKGKTPVSE